jgi:hypothetical protein
MLLHLPRHETRCARSATARRGTTVGRRSRLSFPTRRLSCVRARERGDLIRPAPPLGLRGSADNLRQVFGTGCHVPRHEVMPIVIRQQFVSLALHVLCTAVHRVSRSRRTTHAEDDDACADRDRVARRVHRLCKISCGRPWFCAGAHRGHASSSPVGFQTAAPARQPSKDADALVRCGRARRR